MKEEEALKMLQEADMKEMLTFLIKMLSAYTDEQLVELRERAVSSEEIQFGEEIVIIIDELLAVRKEAKQS